MHVRSHRQRVVGHFVSDCASCWYFQHVWTTEVGTLNDWFQIPIDHGLVCDGQALRLFGADSRYNVVDVLR